MKNHLIVFVAFQNDTIIANSFNSIFKKKNTDFFILENISENSNKIQKYFSEIDDETIIGYIRFDENIANSCVNIFLEQYKDLLAQYQYITITDGDLFIHNIENTFEEIFEGLEQDNVAVVTCDLWLGNDYRNKEILGITEYIIESIHNNKENKCIDGNTGNFLLTFKNQNLNLFDDIIYVDSFIANKINSKGLRWLKTTKNFAYHETWDLYREGNPYYEFKKQVFDKIWFERKNSSFTKIK